MARYCHGHMRLDVLIRLKLYRLAVLRCGPCLRSAAEATAGRHRPPSTQHSMTSYRGSVVSIAPVRSSIPGSAQQLQRILLQPGSLLVMGGRLQGTGLKMPDHVCMCDSASLFCTCKAPCRLTGSIRFLPSLSCMEHEHISGDLGEHIFF